MTRTILAALALSFALAACGPEEDATPSPLIGTWYGTTSASVEGGAPASYGSTLRVGPGASPDVLLVTGVCPDGSGVLQTKSGTNRVDWTGRLVCPWPPGPACSTSTLTYTAARGVLTTTGELSVTATASLAGCGYGPFATTVTFYGRK